MKFTIKKSAIKDVLGKIQSLTSRRSALAVTEMILIKTGENCVHLFATDLETGFEGFYPATIETEGTICINSKKFFEIVREFPQEDIVISAIKENWIEIGFGKVEYHLVGMDPDDFPEKPDLQDVQFFEMESAGLKTMIEKSVVITSAADERRAHINGILFEKVSLDDVLRLRMVSTDGSRLSMVNYPYTGEMQLPEGLGVLIPKKGLTDAARFLESSGIVRVGIHDSRFIVKKTAETLYMRLLEGDFPKYGDIVRKDQSHCIRLNKDLFAMMLKRMSILSTESYKGVIFDMESGQMIISATNPDLGESKEEMDIEYNNDPLKVAFNPKFFVDALSVIDEENVLIYVIDDRKPCVVEGENDRNYLCVIMPMRI